MWRRGTPRSSRGACIPERLRAGGVYLGVDADVARTRSVAACKDFLTFWKDADPDHPICRQAKAEYPKLQCSPRTARKNGPLPSPDRHFGGEHLAEHRVQVLARGHSVDSATRWRNMYGRSRINKGWHMIDTNVGRRP